MSVLTQPVRRANDGGGLAYTLLFLPYLLSLLFLSSPLLSYGIAWSGSWIILGLTMSGSICPIPNDRPIHQQILRPLFLTQITFAGFFCLTSIFHVWSLLNSPDVGSWYAVDQFQRVAAAQRYYVLGHAAFATGLLLAMDYRASGTWTFNLSLSPPRLALALSLTAFALSFVVSQIPGLGQFAVKLRYLAAVSSVLSFALSIRKGDGLVMAVSGVAYFYALGQSFLSGWKHQILAIIGLLLVFLYPYYRRTVTLSGIAVVLFAATLLPAYNGVFRQLNWQGDVSAQRAATQSVALVASGEIDISEKSWEFLEGRATEIGLFTRYLEHTPSERPYYGLTIARQAVLSIIPRALWSEKPNTETLVMQRVYENGVVEEHSEVSAKPQVIVDGYLSGGALGVFVICFLLGAGASWTSRLAERWFGGYAIGGQAVYTSLFADLWLTNSFEFLANATFWAFVLMVLLFLGAYFLGLLHPTRSRSVPRRSPLHRYMPHA